MRFSLLRFQRDRGLYRSDRRRSESDFEETASAQDLIGQKIGNFEIVELIGRGGMGVVYLARDTKLDRSVAIKSMPAELHASSTARTRFMREAKLLASLSHPNVGVIHEIIEPTKGSAYLVLEYIPGETLAERIAQGPLRLKDALWISLQVAEAVCAAHETGVIHRDIKPSNIKITPEGRIKVLDFGLAKTTVVKSATAEPTVTQAGRLMGTPAYMSPEQARGHPMDRRTDIWSFGCLLYEMLTGRLPFEGETTTDVLACIIERNPDWNLLPKVTPANIRVLLRRCLAKEPHRRLQHMGDVVLEIDETLSLPLNSATLNTSSVVAPRTPSQRRLILGIVSVVIFFIAGGLIWWSLKRPISMPVPLSRFPIHLPQNQTFNEQWGSVIAVSPDGNRLVYVGGTVATSQLFLRQIDQVTGKELPETKGASQPFFSPDGQSIGFSSDGKLKTLFLDSGKPKVLCDAPQLVGGTWCPDGTIFFTPSYSKGIWKVSADGSEPEQVTTPVREKGEYGHWWPEVSPGGEVVFFTIWRTSLNDAQIAAFKNRTGELRILVTGASHARYAPTGHLLYAQSGTLVAAPFDLRRLKVGKSRPVIEGLMQCPDVGRADFSFSRNGLLYFVQGGEWLAQRQLVWINRNGQEIETLPLPPHAYTHLRLSPDGKRFIFTKFDRGDLNIWLYELPDGPASQITFEGNNDDPIWMPDNNIIAFQSYRNGPFDVYWMPVNRSSPEKLLVSGSYDQIATSWSKNGKVLLFFEDNPNTALDIWFLSVEDNNTPRPMICESGNQEQGIFSPDGNWIAYESDQEGRSEVYVSPFPNPMPKKISTGGGYHPVWSADGKEIFYRNGDKMIAVTIETEPDLKVINSEVLFEGKYFVGLGRNYDVSGDGQRFLMIKESKEQTSAIQLIVVLNWFEELKQLVPLSDIP